MHCAKLHRLARYMLQCPENSWDNEHQHTPQVLEVLTDRLGRRLNHRSLCDAPRNDLALDGLQCRRANCGCVEQWRERGLRDGEGCCLLAFPTRQLLCQLGVSLRLGILCGTRGISTRSGSGKVRQGGAGNIAANVGTKVLEKDRLDSLMLQMPHSRGERRTATVAIAALPFLNAFSPKENNETC